MEPANERLGAPASRRRDLDWNTPAGRQRSQKASSLASCRSAPGLGFSLLRRLLHPLHDFDSENVESLLQNARRQIAQRQTGIAHRFFRHRSLSLALTNHIQNNRRMKFIPALVVFLSLFAGAGLRAEDGYSLWLRYGSLPAEKVATYQPRVEAVVVPGDSATAAAIRKELVAGCSGLLGRPVPAVGEVDRDGAIIAGTPKSVPTIDELKLDEPLARLGPDGFLIRSVKIHGHAATVIASMTDIGALYGAFYFLRLVQTLQPIDELNVSEKPRLKLRLLDHWDNLNGSIERGYAGRSLWDWKALPDTVDLRLRDYARANASIGINGAVLNNVNASARSLSLEYLRKTAAIADTLRPYGVRVYLVPRFSAPIDLGKLKTADPLDPEVAAWWKAKVDEIYRLIPDFGGFLVKANSEGQPGPVTYKRTHADGANMIAAALAPHGGVVMWRAFVYDAKPGSDRVAQAYDALKPFDGQFATNVLLQVKNGPLDFQPREPFHPLFGGMTNTQVMPELQITQEYLGHANHLVFLATMWREFFDSDTFAKGPGSTVAKVVDGSLHGQRLTGIAGVANTGSDRNWTGHDFAQANWYAFGRLAWNPDIPAQQIAGEWIRMTFTRDEPAVKTISGIMLESREAVVDYMTPLGLASIMNGPHYGPEPWGHTAGRPDWNPVYYHRADTNGIGFDRTSTGSDAVSQYYSPLRERFADLATCPEEFLLFFHRVPWDYKMHSGRTLWDELGLHYQRGINWVGETRTKWDALSGVIDPERHASVAAKLAIQEHDAIWWRDAGILYFQTFAKCPLPIGMSKPQHTLEELMSADPLTGEPKQ
jgi:alpha-glucuronidase